VRKADNLPPSCAGVMKSRNLNFLEPSGNCSPVTGLILFSTHLRDSRCLHRCDGNAVFRDGPTLDDGVRFFRNDGKTYPATRRHIAEDRSPSVNLIYRDIGNAWL